MRIAAPAMLALAAVLAFVPGASAQDVRAVDVDALEAGGDAETWVFELSLACQRVVAPETSFDVHLAASDVIAIEGPGTVTTPATVCATTPEVRTMFLVAANASASAPAGQYSLTVDVQARTLSGQLVPQSRTVADAFPFNVTFSPQAEAGHVPSAAEELPGLAGAAVALGIVGTALAWRRGRGAVQPLSRT